MKKFQKFGKDNSNWRGGKVNKNCSYCGKEYEVYPCRFNISKFCSVSCGAKERKFTEETKQKISKAQLGKKLSEITKQKIRAKLMGNKNTMGRILSEEHKRKLLLVNIGRKFSEESKKKMSKIRKGRFTGEKSGKWKGGITPINEKIRKSFRYKEWREKVFKRDDYTCQACKNKSRGDINAHHIKSFADFPKLRYRVNNGITLCEKCHKLTDNYFRMIKIIKYGEQLKLNEGKQAILLIKGKE